MEIARLDRVQKVLRAVRGYVSGYRAYKFLKIISLYHRIQASRGLIDAISQLERVLFEEAPDNVEVNSFKYTGRAGPEWLNLPAKWEIHDAWIEIQGKRYTYSQHPTLPAAHTPPSDGTIRGEVVKISDPLDEREYEKNKDKVLLVTKHHRVAYRLAAEQGVSAMIIADESKHHDSFPYYGLFLTKEEAEKATTVAVTVPWNIGNHLEGKHVELRVDSDLGGPGELPVLIAWIGDKDTEGPSLIAHICHPTPGANDNASGSSAALEAFLSIAAAVEDGVLPEPDQTIRLILLPEYTGSILSMEGWLSNLSNKGLNLDMVGRTKEYSVEPRLLYTPITHGPSMVGDTYFDAVYSAGIGTPIEYYMAGSDHDVFLAYGRDGVMINQWPDTFYHTDSDDANTISIRYLQETAYTAAATIYLLSTDYKPTDQARRKLLDLILQKHVAKGDLETARLARSIIPLRYEIEGVPQSEEVSWSPVKDDRVIEPRVPLYAGLLTLRMELHEIIEFTRKLDTIEIPREVYNEIFYAGRNSYSIDRLHSELASIYGINDLDNKLIVLLEAFEAHRLISLK